MTSSCEATSGKTTLVFTYGTLKRGFSNHGLLQDMISTGDASFQGNFRTSNNLPLVCGPYRVPFLLNLPGYGDHRVLGEVYAVSPMALARMDQLEGTTRGHYERLPITVVNDNDDSELEAEAYYAHRSYAEEMWKRNGKNGYGCYTKKVAEGYVYRKDRPPHLSFLDHIRLFLSTPTNYNLRQQDDHVVDSPPRAGGGGGGAAGAGAGAGAGASMRLLNQVKPTASIL